MAQGGNRPGAGRKKVKDKKVQLSIYPHTSIIKKAGGMEKAKIVCLKALEKCG